MNEIPEIIHIIFKISALLLPVILIAQYIRKIKRIPKMTTFDLKALFTNRSKAFYFHKATEELKARGEDISFLLPVFLDLALSGKYYFEMLGKANLKNHFSDIIPKNINLDEKRLTKETKSQIVEIQKKVEDILNPNT